MLKTVIFLFIFLIIRVAFSNEENELNKETIESNTLKYFTDPFLDTYDSLTNAEDS